MNLILTWIVKNPFSSILMVVVLILSGTSYYYKKSSAQNYSLYLTDEKTIVKKEDVIKDLKASNDGLFLMIKMQNSAIDKLKVDAKQADKDHTAYVNQLKSTFDVERQKLLRNVIQYKVDCNNSASIKQADDALTTVHFLFGDKK